MHTYNSIIRGFLKMLGCEYMYGFVMTCSSVVCKYVCKEVCVYTCESACYEGVYESSCKVSYEQGFQWLLCAKCQSPSMICTCVHYEIHLYDCMHVCMCFKAVWCRGSSFECICVGRCYKCWEKRWLGLFLRSKWRSGIVCSSVRPPPNTFQKW